MLSASQTKPSILPLSYKFGENGFTVMGWVKTNSNNGEIFSLGEESKSGFSSPRVQWLDLVLWAIRPIVLIIHLLIHGITLQLPLNQ